MNAWFDAWLSRYSLRVVAQPTTEQITLEQARLHLRLDAYNSPPEHADDQELLDTIPTAREYCEMICGRSLAPQTLELALEAFPPWGRYGRATVYVPGFSMMSPAPVVSLPMTPIAGIVSVKYYDSDGTLTTMSPALYGFDTSEPARLYSRDGAGVWPATQAVPNAVLIRYQAGFDVPGDSPNDRPLPARYRSAMLLMLGHLYENREATDSSARASGGGIIEMPLGVRALLDPDSARLGFA
jgi:uncharacterized phiE125 gp8 family phage protein